LTMEPSSSFRPFRRRGIQVILEDAMLREIPQSPFAKVGL